MNVILDKCGLASQPTISRFFNRMDEDTMSQFNITEIVPTFADCIERGLIGEASK